MASFVMLIFGEMPSHSEGVPIAGSITFIAVINKDDGSSVVLLSARAQILFCVFSSLMSSLPYQLIPTLAEDSYLDPAFIKAIPWTDLLKLFS